MAIMRGDRPQRPTHPACSDELWALVQRCWNRDPHLRPEVSEVFQVLPSSILDKLRRLYEPGTASHEFQLALGRFYGCTNYQDSIYSLHGTELNEFVNFLDSVRQPSNLFRSSPHLTLGIGAPDEGVESKPTPTNAVQPAESLR